MSIYATLWTLRFPSKGDDYRGCDWIEVRAQAVPGHIGTPLPGYGYEDGDPYASFLPPPIITDPDSRNRAVVIVTKNTRKGTARSGQEYVDPLLTLTDEEYERITFRELHDTICDLLRDESPRVVATIFRGDSIEILREDHSVEIKPLDEST